MPWVFVVMCGLSLAAASRDYSLVARCKFLTAVASLLVAQMVKNLPAVQKTWVQSLGPEDLLEKGNGYPLQYSCLENPMDLWSLVTYSPWGHKVSDKVLVRSFYSETF